MIFGIFSITNTANNIIFYNEKNNTNLLSKNHFNDIRVVLKKEILFIKDYSYKILKNYHFNKEVNFLSVFKNCAIFEIQLEVQNYITLMNYFRSKALLNKSWNILKRNYLRFQNKI